MYSYKMLQCVTLKKIGLEHSENQIREGSILLSTRLGRHYRFLKFCPWEGTVLRGEYNEATQSSQFLPYCHTVKVKNVGFHNIN